MKYYKLKDDNSVYGHFYEEDGFAHATQHKWQWSNGVGVEKENEKKPREVESFFTVNVEIDLKEFNNLWGLGLERL